MGFLLDSYAVSQPAVLAEVVSNIPVPLVSNRPRVSCEALTSIRETDSSTHLDKRRKHHHVASNSQFDLQNPEAVHCCF